MKEIIMALQLGIVGLPNVGKSTLFNALTNAQIEAANYPFCTIEPNVGIIELNDSRIDALVEIIKPQKIVKATVEFVDIAGLVAGASKGEGLGNQFLANIRQVDAIVHVVRCFSNDDIVHVSNKIDPLDDVMVINTELALADLSTLEKTYIKEQKKAKSGDKASILLSDIIKKCIDKLNAGIMLRNAKLDHHEQEQIQHLQLLTIKPILYVANVDENGFNNNAYLDTLKDHAISEDACVIPICVLLESEISSLSIDDKLEFLSSIGVSQTGLDRLGLAGYKLLGLHTYFTAGVQEVRAWTIPVGANAMEAAGVIHTDFARGFIKAQVIAYDDFIKFGGESGAKTAGKLRLEGKEYIVQDADVMHFRFNV